MVPVIDMKRDRHDLFPKIGIALQLAEPFFRGRTTAAAFRGEELEQGCPRDAAFEGCSRDR